MYYEDEQEDREALDAKIRAEEDRIDDEIRSMRNSIEEMNDEYQYFLKKSDNQLSSDYLSSEDRKFFEEQREMYRKIQMEIQEKFSEIESTLIKEKNNLYDSTR